MTTTKNTSHIDIFSRRIAGPKPTFSPMTVYSIHRDDTAELIESLEPETRRAILATIHKSIYGQDYAD